RTRHSAEGFLQRVPSTNPASTRPPMNAAHESGQIEPRAAAPHERRSASRPAQPMIGRRKAAAGIRLHRDRAIARSRRSSPPRARRGNKSVD
ncbi:hypothetical protein, partial [Burkholderia pseudomallei]|uniref:hypothetical protein n=1 Tax=Burkholderia pseudomallei TaxID=28450 RepID=UPI001C3C631F